MKHQNWNKSLEWTEICSKHLLFLVINQVNVDTIVLVKIFWVLKDFYLYFCENFEPFDADWAKLADSCSTVRLSRCKCFVCCRNNLVIKVNKNFDNTLQLSLRRFSVAPNYNVLTQLVTKSQEKQMVSSY